MYRAILRHPGSGQAELAARLRCSEQDIRVALDQLMMLRPVQSVKGRPDRVRPVSPQVALGALLVRAETEVNRHRSEIEMSRSAVQVLAEEYGSGSGVTADLVIRHEGREALQRRLVELASEAKSTCRTLQPDDWVVQEDGDSIAVSKFSLAQGLQVQEVRQDIFRSDPVAYNYVRNMAALGAEIRVVPALPMRVVLFDEDCALVPSDPTNCELGAIELRSLGAVAAVRALFDQVWSIADPWDDAPQPDHNGLLPRERELLRLLAAGHTDEAASRQLGLSLRTVRRLVARLMDLLAADSRFEAGVNAAKRHWI
ncbi:MAG: helix-turn-helix transcriptional regulator [Umezawaea sp.]